MIDTLLKPDIKQCIYSSLNNKLYKMAKSIIPEDRYISYEILSNRRNYMLEDVIKIQMNYAFERIYLTFYYETYKIQTYIIETKAKGYLQEKEEQIKKEVQNEKVDSLKKLDSYFETFYEQLKKMFIERCPSGIKTE